MLIPYGLQEDAREFLQQWLEAAHDVHMLLVEVRQRQVPRAL